MSISVSTAVSMKTLAYRRIIRELSKENAELKSELDYLYQYIEDFENPEPIEEEEGVE